MKRKIIFCIYATIYFIPIAYGMEQVDNKDPKKIERHESDDIIIPMVDSVGNPTKAQKRKSAVPPLKLPETNVTSPKPRSDDNRSGSPITNRGPQTPIKSLDELHRKVASVKAIHTGRIAGSGGATTRRFPIQSTLNERSTSVSPVAHKRGKRSLSADQQDDVVVTGKRASLLPKAMVQQLTDRDFPEDIMYSEIEVWEILQNCNPLLHAFGQKHNMDLEQLKEYAVLMRELDIDPRVITEHAHQTNQQKQASLLNQSLAYIFGDADKQHQERLNKQYEKIKKKDPDNYMELVLELMKAAADQAAGQQNRSPIADTHTALQSSDINAQTTTIRQQHVALLLTVLGLASGWITSALQFFSPTNSTKC